MVTVALALIAPAKPTVIIAICSFLIFMFFFFLLLEIDFVNNYAVRLRRIRRVLAPNGSSNSAPATMVVGSGTVERLGPKNP
jgi:hypothetical protein